MKEEIKKVSMEVELKMNGVSLQKVIANNLLAEDVEELDDLLTIYFAGTVDEDENDIETQEETIIDIKAWKKIKKVIKWWNDEQVKL